MIRFSEEIAVVVVLVVISTNDGVTVYEGFEVNIAAVAVLVVISTNEGVTVYEGFEVNIAVVAQLVRALACHVRGRGFESHRPRNTKATERWFFVARSKQA